MKGLKEDMNILRQFSTFGPDAHEDIEKQFVLKLIRRGEDQSPRFVFQYVMLQRLMFRAAFAINEKQNRNNEDDIEWPELPSVDLYPQWLFDRISPYDVATLPAHLLFGHDEQQYKSAAKKQTGKKPPLFAAADFKDSLAKETFETNRNLQQKKEASKA